MKNPYIKDLESVLEVTRLITQTQDFGLVGQKIVNVIPLLGGGTEFTSAVLYIFDNKEKAFVFHSLTQSPLITKATQEEYIQPIEHRKIFLDDNTLLTKLFFSHEIQISSTILDFVGTQLSESEFKRLQERIGYKSFICLPLVIHGEVIGALQVASSIAKDNLPDRALKILQNYVEQAAIALRNAMLYEEQKANLQVLRERTSDLTSMQQIAREITSSLKFKDVAQRIVDYIGSSKTSVHGKQNLAIGTLYIFDEKKRLFRFYMMSNNKLANKLRNLHEIPYEKRLVSLKSVSQNALQRVYFSGEIQICSTLADVVGDDALNVELTLKIIKREGVKSYIVLPLKARNKIIGALQVSTLFNKNTVPQRIIDNLQSFAAHAAIALENAHLYEKVRQINKELQTTNERLRELDVAKTEFVSIASHQLRTPLTAIRGYNSLVLEENIGKLNNKQRNFLLQTMVSAERMMMLINDLLDMSNMETGKFALYFSQADYLLLVNETIKDFELMVESKHIRIEKRVPSHLPLITIDPDKVRQILINLVDNAIKYGKEDSTITISVEHKNGEILTSVQDEGVGIEEDKREWIFEKFYRGDRARESSPNGSGIGLFVVKKIVEYHRGRIWVDSVIGKGSTFHFTLPVKRTELKESTPDVGEKKVKISKQKTK
ncbi:MAG: ATP-binding protein [bacterium]